MIEQSPALARHLAQRFPQVRVVQADAAELALLRTAPDWPRGDDGVPFAGAVHRLRTLPLPIPSEVRQRILLAGAQVLAPGGRLAAVHPRVAVNLALADGRAGEWWM